MRQYMVTEYDKEDYDSFEENMTNEQVVDILKDIESGYIPDYDYTGTERDFENYKLHAALWKAVEVLGGMIE